MLVLIQADCICQMGLFGSTGWKNLQGFSEFFTLCMLVVWGPVNPVFGGTLV